MKGKFSIILFLMLFYPGNSLFGEDSVGNHLVNELSPYLLQHAYNPVNWYPWGEEAFRIAQRENKAVIISIGYSSCHWCHVMEEESFEDDEVAALMNEYFINIKVDREERPDVDSHYMNSLQLISGRGGWPLNIFALPDGRAFYGGSYFPRDVWIDLLKQIQSLYQNNYESLLGNARAVEKGMDEYREQLLGEKQDDGFDLSLWLDESQQTLDSRSGGLKGSPKFPMPLLYSFLQTYSQLYGRRDLQNHVSLTLDQMIGGGLYDQLGGGFSRYSTDADWKIPHFEKMLYDNALLISLYSDAYRRTGRAVYAGIVEDSLDFIDEVMTSPEGLFYSALDADSQGEEGSYYLWDSVELSALLGPEYELAAELYRIGDIVYPDNGKIILGFDHHRTLSRDEQRQLESIRKRLSEERNKRISPGLDDKVLTDWNGLMISAYCDAYRALGDPVYLERAEEGARSLLLRQMDDEYRLKHVYKEGVSYVRGFLSDYAYTVSALIDLFLLSGKENYLEDALALQDSQDRIFRDRESGFYFSSVSPPSESATAAVKPSFDIVDTVVPSPNAVSAHNLFRLYSLHGKEEYRRQYKNMLQRMGRKMEESPLYFSHWAELYLLDSRPYYELVVCGPEARELAGELQRLYLPGSMTVFSTLANEDSSLFRGRFKKGETFIYVCRDNSCLLPVASLDEALRLMEAGVSEDF